MKISIISIIIIFSLKCIIINSQLISNSQNVEEQKTDIIVSIYNLFLWKGTLTNAIFFS